MKRIIPTLITFIVIAQAALPTMAQDLSAEKWFDQKVGLENTGLFNGYEYHFPFRGANSHPFFFAEGASKGMAHYRDQWYPDISLMYDLFTNEVILRFQATDGTTKLMCFDQSFLEAFTLFGHSFININSVFYDVLYKGSDWSLLATRKKTTHVQSSRVEFEEDVQYFIMLDKVLTEYSGKESFMKLCPQPAELQNFIKQNRIKISKKREDDLVLVASFVEKLRKPAR